MLFFMFINVKMPTIVGILTFMSGKNFMLNRVEDGKSFITSGPGFTILNQSGIVATEFGSQKCGDVQLLPQEHVRLRRVFLI